jgi:hypothetical protein
MESKKAKELADLKNEKLFDLSTLIAAILDNAECGEYSLSIYDKKIPDSIIAKLEKLGYHVRKLNASDEINIPCLRYIIEW